MTVNATWPTSSPERSGERRAGARLERRCEVRPTDLERRHEAGEASGEQGHPASEQHDAAIHRRRERRDVGEQEGADDGTRPQRHEQRGDSPREGEQHALSDELASEAKPGGPQSQTDGNLALTLQRAGEQEIGDVGTGDEQHDHRNGREPHRDSGVLRHLRSARMLHGPEERDCGGIPTRVHVLSAERLRSLARRRLAAGRSEPPDDLEEVRATVEDAGPHQLRGSGPERHPRVDVFEVHAGEPLRRYADHGVPAAPELELSPENAGVAPEGRAPESVTQHNDRGAAQTVFVGRVEAPQHRPHTEQREVARRGEHHVHAASVDAAPQARTLRVGARREPVEGPR